MYVHIFTYFHFISQYHKSLWWKTLSALVVVLQEPLGFYFELGEAGPLVGLQIPAVGHQVSVYLWRTVVRDLKAEKKLFQVKGVSDAPRWDILSNSLYVQVYNETEFTIESQTRCTSILSVLTGRFSGSECISNQKHPTKHFTNPLCRTTSFW